MMRSRAIGARLQRSSSELRKARSNVALWATSGASAMNASISSQMSTNSGLSLRNSLDRPCTPEGALGHVALGIHVAMEVLSGRKAVEQLDAADLDQPVALQGVEAGGFRVEHDLAHAAMTI